jgi:hypothetical protein
MHRATAALTTTLAAAVVALFAGCAPTAACADWPTDLTEQALYEESTFVAVGFVNERAGSIPSLTGQARAYSFFVDELVKGDADEGLVVIGSRPESCTDGGPYGTGDQLLTDDRVLVYAVDEGDGLLLITPYQGVTPLPEGSPLPFVVED